MQSNGTLQPSFWPAAPPVALPAPSPPVPPVLWSPILAPSSTPPAAWRRRPPLVKGLRNDVGRRGQRPRPRLLRACTPGYASIGTFNDPWGAGISIDQHLRRTLTFSEPFPTLNCGVLASDTPPFKAHRRSFSYSAAKQQIPTEFDPYRLYARFFGLGTSVPPGRGSGGGHQAPAARASRRCWTTRVADLQSLRPRLPQAGSREAGRATPTPCATWRAGWRPR